MSSTGDGLLRISTALHNCREGRLTPVRTVTPEWMREVAREADRLGYYSLWLNEFLDTDPKVRAASDVTPYYYDALVTIADAAARTERIRFLTSTLVLPLHHPLLLARQLATLDAFTNGRVSLGIGLGGTPEEFKRLRGELTKVHRGRMMDEYVEAIRALLEHDKASFEGTYASFRDVEIAPRPVQRRLPIFMAGHAAGVFQRLAAHGDGWIDSSTAPDEIAATIGRIGELRSSMGRDGAVEVARQFYVAIGRTEAEAEEIADSTDTGADKAARARLTGVDRTLIGTPDAIAGRIADYVAAGVTEVCAIFFASTASDVVRQMTLFAEEVTPRLRSGIRTVTEG
jgi:probable F420-dependent oxidoreductase